MMTDARAVVAIFIDSGYTYEYSSSTKAGYEGNRYCKYDQSTINKVCRRTSAILNGFAIPSNTRASHANMVWLYKTDYEKFVKNNASFDYKSIGLRVPVMPEIE